MNEGRILNNYDAMVNTFSLSMKKVTVVEGTKEAALLARWLNFNYGDAPIKMTTMILWQAPVDISSLNHQEGSLVIHSCTFGELISREYVVLALRYDGHGLS